MTSLILASLLSAATAGKHVAVLEFRNGLPPADKAAIGERARYSDAARRVIGKLLPDGAKVMTREEMVQLANANPAALDRCNDDNCLEVGKLIGADAVIEGVFTKSKKGFTLTLRLFDTATGQLLASSDAHAATAERLLAEVDKSAAVLGRALQPK